MFDQNLAWLEAALPSGVGPHARFRHCTFTQDEGVIMDFQLFPMAQASSFRLIPQIRVFPGRRWGGGGTLP